MFRRPWALLTLSALLPPIAGLASAQNNVRIPVEAPGAPAVVVPGAGTRMPGGSPLDIGAFSASGLRLQSLVSRIGGSPVDPRVFNRFYDNNALQGAPESQPQAPAPKPQARPVPFKDITLPPHAFSEQTRISELLVNAIDKTEKTLDLALHGLSLPNVAEALVRAKQRGVKIRILINASHVFPEKKDHNRSPEIQLLIDNKFELRTLRGGSAHGVMHNKIALFDGVLLKYGSFNWTKAADEKNYENAQFRGDAAKIARYQRQYERLWKAGRPYEQGPKAEGEVDPESIAPGDSEETVEYNGESFPAEMWSPQGGVEEALVRAIGATKKGETIDVAMFSLYSDPLGQTLIKAKQRGVNVRLVVDVSQGKRSPVVKSLVENGFSIRWTSGHATGGVLHHKFAVFNGKMLATGSYNWTNNAEYNNYENINFEVDPSEVAAFLEEFETLYGLGAPPGLAEFVADPLLLDALGDPLE